MLKNKILALLGAAMIACSAAAAESAEDAKVAEADSLSAWAKFEQRLNAPCNRVPQIHGVFRGRYEGEWEDGYESRFQVRNMRVLLKGYIVPEIDYYVRVDLSNKGSFTFLDAWARWYFKPEWAVKFGRFRVPFGVDIFRGPGTYIFANRSFLAENMANLRAVGVQFSYVGKIIPLTVDVGMFNSATGTNQDVWQKEFDFAGKASYRLGEFILSGSFLSMYPYGVRLNVADGSVAWRRDRLLLEAEYQHLHYCTNAYRDVNAAVAFASYDVPVRWYPFNVLNFHGRWDYMGNHSTGKPDDNGVLLTDDPERQRMTFGASVRCNVKKVKAEFILDFEKYFYRHGVSAPRGLGDKICAEVVVSF